MTDAPAFTNTFYRPCTSCGKTIDTIAGIEQAHDCDPHPDMGVAICRAYWNGVDRGKTEILNPPPNMEDEPAVGRIVHYTDNPNFLGDGPHCRAALVANVNPDKTLDLVEFLAPDALAPAMAVEQGKTGQLYTWHWPEREDGR